MHRKTCLRYDGPMIARFTLLLAFLAAPLPGAAQPPATPLDRALRQQSTPPDPAAAIRAGRWAEAAEAAARLRDPLALKLVTFARLLTQNAANTAEIAAFAADNPAWPNPSLLERRRQEALARESDPPTLATECPRAPLTLRSALLRCAEAMRGTPGFAQQAWITADITDPVAEVDFLSRFSDALTPADQLARFEALLANNTAAARQITRLDPSQRNLAETRLALRGKDANAPALVAALSPGDQSNSGLFLDYATYLREAGQDEAALALWRAGGEAAQAAMAQDQRGKFWTERHRFARQTLRTGNAENAYMLAAIPGALPSDVQLDANFLAGFIALRRLNDPARAIPHFRALAAASPATLTQSRAWYWLGRAEATANRDPAPAYTKAAEWPLTYYGQLSALALGETEEKLAERIRTTRDPEIPAELASQIAEREGIRAAKHLIAWGEPRRAGAFFVRMDELAGAPAERAALARLALRMKLPDVAVMTARRMGRDGFVLAESGWPMPVSPPTAAIAPAVSLALMRQESNFDIGIVSPAGARGLMQLMPATAQAVAKRLGEPTSPAALTTDAAHNMRLGTAYLKDMQEQFTALPLAIAAYNAGPHRVKAWLSANGDPRPSLRGATGTEPSPDMIDWIELIPFNETRNYVQRVLENIAIYRVRRGDAPPELLAEWTPRR